jgi:uncharacterized protein
MTDVIRMGADIFNTDELVMMEKTPINQPLRKNRARGDAWIKAFLHRGAYGMLATEHEGQPFIKPVNYAYAESENAIYFHGALKGRTRVNIENNPRVSFCVAEMGRLLPAETARGVGVEYASVVVFGRVELTSDAEQARHGLQLLLDRYFPHLKTGIDYREINAEDLMDTAVYRLAIDSWSGKATQGKRDIPGAFDFKPPFIPTEG